MIESIRCETKKYVKEFVSQKYILLSKNQYVFQK